MENNIVETIGLTKKFKHQTAVNAINLHVPKGAIYGFIGRNGAGKSTALKMICGLVKPTSGEIRLFNEAHFDLAYRSIGALIENVGAYPELSARENMLLKATGLGLNDKEEIESLLILSGLNPKDKKPVKQFSLGMKQRLGIALALLGNPDLLILDEPINGLDPEGIREIRNTILKLNEEKGMTFIISSHILSELDKVATHYGIIKDGELIEEISQKDLAEKCKSYLAMRVDDLKKTTFILEEKLGIKDYEIKEDGELHVFTQNNSQMLNTELMKQGIQISQIYYQKQDLESYFLNKVGGQDHA